MNEDVKSVFTPALMISFRSARKRSSYLVRAKIYLLERNCRLSSVYKGNGVKLVTV